MGVDFASDPGWPYLQELQCLSTLQVLCINIQSKVGILHFILKKIVFSLIIKVIPGKDIIMMPTWV